MNQKLLKAIYVIAILAAGITALVGIVFMLTSGHVYFETETMQEIIKMNPEYEGNEVTRQIKWFGFPIFVFGAISAAKLWERLKKVF